MILVFKLCILIVFADEVVAKEDAVTGRLSKLNKNHIQLPPWGSVQARQMWGYLYKNQQDVLGLAFDAVIIYPLYWESLCPVCTAWLFGCTVRCKPSLISPGNAGVKLHEEYVRQQELGVM